MIVGEQKSLMEIRNLVLPYPKLLILGCGTCVKTCFAGGEDEVAVLGSALRLLFARENNTIRIEELTVERQCENEFISEAASRASDADAVLSLACGAGVQALAQRFPKTPVLPGINTTFLGILEKQGVFTEQCSGCGDCQLETFGGICPYTRCAKKLQNGPCGGSRGGRCEVNADVACAWHLIIERLTALGEISRLKTYIPPKSWKNAGSGGPRKLVREDHMI
ncbi:MAG: methylenetetrahydrofolate reductase C-terminal domain-containing protein [Thermodesulfobacteriota bacterium]